MSQTEVSQIWYTRCPVPTASSIAIDEGMLDRAFESDRISVASLRASSEMGVRNSHFDHSQANSFREGGNIPPLWTRARGGDNRLVACGWVDEYQALISLPSAGISKLADLKGRRFGVPRRVNDMIDYWQAMCLRAYLTTLSLAGLSREDVEFVGLPIEEKYIGSEGSDRTGTLWSGGHRARRQQAETFALIRGEVDVIYTAGASGAQLSALLGAQTVVDLGFHPDPIVRANNQIPIILTVSGRLLEEWPEVVDRYLATLIAASDWAKDNAASVRRTVANDVGATEEWVVAAYPPDFHRKLTPALEETAIGALKNQKDFLVREGFIDADVDIDAWISEAPLSRCSSAR